MFYVRSILGQKRPGKPSRCLVSISDFVETPPRSLGSLSAILTTKSREKSKIPNFAVTYRTIGNSYQVHVIWKLSNEKLIGTPFAKYILSLPLKKSYRMSRAEDFFTFCLLSRVSWSFTVFAWISLACAIFCISCSNFSFSVSCSCCIRSFSSWWQKCTIIICTISTLKSHY